MSKKSRQGQRPAHKQTTAETADKYFQAGLDAAAREDFAGVISHMTRAIELSPELGRAYFQRGMARYMLGDVTHAINDLADSVELNATAAAEIMELSAMAGEAIAIEMARPLAEEIFEALMEAGLIFQEVEEYKRSLMAFNQAAGMFADEPEIYQQRGETYFLMGNYTKAVADYTRALRLDSEMKPMLLRRAMAYRLMNEFEKAFADLESAMELTPTPPNLYTERGAVYAGQGDFEKALANFEQAKELDVDNYGLPLVLIGLAQTQLGQLAEAQKTWELVLALLPMFENPEGLREFTKMYPPFAAATEKLIDLWAAQHPANNQDDTVV